MCVGDVVSMFIKRLKVQILQLQGVVESLYHKAMGHHLHRNIIDRNDAGDDVNDDEDDDDDLVRDSFSLHKMIVAVTSAGKVSYKNIVYIIC